MDIPNSDPAAMTLDQLTWEQGVQEHALEEYRHEIAATASRADLRSLESGAYVSQRRLEVLTEELERRRAAWQLAASGVEA